MIKMDMGQEYGIEVRNREAVLSELFRESSEGRSGPGIDKRHVIIRAQERRGNRVTMAGPEEVNGDRRIHRKKQFSATTERSISKWSGMGETGSDGELAGEWEEALAE